MGLNLAGSGRPRAHHSECLLQNAGGRLRQLVFLQLIFGGEYDGRPPELLVVRADHRESRALGVEACLLAISKSGDLAVALKSKLIGFVRVGTLARLPINGGAPREIADNVQEADWAPDGSLAAIRWNFPIVRIEYPIGHVVYKAAPPVWVSNLRVSPDGARIAFLLHESERFDDRGRAVVMDRSGEIVSRSRVFARGQWALPIRVSSSTIALAACAASV